MTDLGVVGTGVDRGATRLALRGARRDGRAGHVFQTDGIVALSPADQSAIREKVENFDAFTPDNDPYGEHDFGGFEHNGSASSGKSTTTTEPWNMAAKTPPIRLRRCAC